MLVLLEGTAAIVVNGIHASFWLVSSGSSQKTENKVR